MAYKFYHRFSAADFQRYREFFPKFEPESSRGGVATTKNTANSRSDATVMHGKTADDKTRDKITTRNKLWGQRCNDRNAIPIPPNSYEDDDDDDDTPSPLIPSPNLSAVSTTSSTTPPSSSSDSSPSESSRARRRKTSRPRRSPKRNDPKFKGVTFSMETAILHGKQEAKLTIKSQLSIRRYRRMLTKRSMTGWRRVLHRGFYFRGNSQTGGRTLSDSSSSETDSDTELGMKGSKAFKSVSNKARMFPRLYVRSLSQPPNTPAKVGRHSGRLPPHTIPDPLKAHGKTCESCKTTRTPLWRDAEDGTPLCNACGIRYKKYRIRCPFCWLIPRKDSKTFPYCGRCGVLLKMMFQRRFQYL